MLKAGEVFEIAMLAHDTPPLSKRGPSPRGVAITRFLIPEGQRLK
jgi:hypothetical protein